MKSKKNIYELVNLFHATGLFTYPLKASEKEEVFWCFQGISKESNVMK